MNTTDALIEAFLLGIDYGLLIAEEERDGEDVFDAFLCGVGSRKMCVPTVPAPRRQSHSAAWRKAKSDSRVQFVKLYAQVLKETT